MDDFFLFAGALGLGIAAALRRQYFAVRTTATGDSGLDVRHEGSYGGRARNGFQLDPLYVHLNHGSYGSCPNLVRKERINMLEKIERYPDRFFRQQAVHKYKYACDAAGTIIGAKPGECVLVENATYAMDVVIGSVDVPAGATVVVFSATYGAVKRSVQSACEKYDARIVEVPLKLGTSQATEQSFTEPLLEALQEEARHGREVALVVLDHITSPTAIVTPVLALARLCKENGVRRVAVDGAHAPGLLDISPASLDAAGVDFYWGNLHKWCFTPRGVAVLRAAPGAPRKELRNPTVSHFAKEPLQWQFFMCGTNDQSRFLAVPAAMQFVESLGGLHKVAAYCHDLAQWGAWRLLDRFNERESASGSVPRRTFSQLAPASMCVSMAVVQTPLDPRFFVHPGRRGEMDGGAGRSESSDTGGKAATGGGGASDRPEAGVGSGWRTADADAVERVVQSDPMLAERIARLVQKRFRIYTVVYSLPGTGVLWCRLSAQVYNQKSDYALLADAIVTLCDECDAGRDPLVEGLDEGDWGFGRVDPTTGAMCSGVDGPERRGGPTTTISY